MRKASHNDIPEADVMPAPLRKRAKRFPETLIRTGLLHPMARSFHAPQRDRPAKVQHPKPRKAVA